MDKSLVRKTISEEAHTESVNTHCLFSFIHPRLQQHVVLLLACLMIVVLIISVSWSWSVQSKHKESQSLGNYFPFNLYDAADQCQTRMREKLGERLLRSHLDEHSSRADKTVFRVYFKADVGSLTQFDEVMVYCFVDRWGYNLSYYREVNPNVKELKSTDLKFFQ